MRGIPYAPEGGDDEEEVVRGHEAPVQLEAFHDAVAPGGPLDADHRDARQIYGFHVPLYGPHRDAEALGQLGGAYQFVVEEVDDYGEEAVDFHGPADIVPRMGRLRPPASTRCRFPYSPLCLP